MPISVTCTCGKKLTAPDDAAGKKAKCPDCGTRVLIPANAPPTSSRASSDSSASSRYRREVQTEQPPASEGTVWTSFTNPLGIEQRGLIATSSEFIHVTGPPTRLNFILSSIPLALVLCPPLGIPLLIFQLVMLFPLKMSACWKAFKQHDLAAIKTFTRWYKSYPLDSCDIRFEDNHLRITAGKLKMSFKANDRTRDEYRAFAKHARGVPG